MPLEPARETHDIYWGDYKLPPEPTPAGNRTTIPAVHIKQGTKPAGSTWTRNPIPACFGDLGGGNMSDCDGPQFAPPIPGLFGFGPARCVSQLPTDFRKVLNPLNFHKWMNCSFEEYNRLTDLFNFNIADTIKVPNAPGDYVLSFRWGTLTTKLYLPDFSWCSCACQTASRHRRSGPVARTYASCDCHLLEDRVRRWFLNASLCVTLVRHRPLCLAGREKFHRQPATVVRLGCRATSRLHRKFVGCCSVHTMARDGRTACRRRHDREQHR